MKKAYSIPQLFVTRVTTVHLFSASTTLDFKSGDIESESNVLVKDNNSNYNVWNDDWSE